MLTWNRRPLQNTELPESMVVSQPNKLQIALAVFHQSGAVFNPVTRVAVGDAVNVYVLRSVNMAADYAVTTAVTRMPDHLITKMSDVPANRTQATLQPCNKRAIAVQCRRSGTAPKGVRPQHPFVEQA